MSVRERIATVLNKTKVGALIMGIYEQGKLLGLDKPLSHEERTYIEEVLCYYNKHSFVHRSLLRLLCAERKANEKE